MRKHVEEVLFRRHPELYSPEAVTRGAQPASRDFPVPWGRRCESGDEFFEVGEGWLQIILGATDAIAATATEQGIDAGQIIIRGVRRSWDGDLAVALVFSGEIQDGVADCVRGVIGMATALARITCPVCGEPADESSGRETPLCKICALRHEVSKVTEW